MVLGLVLSTNKILYKMSFNSLPKKGGDEKPYDDEESKNDLAITGGKKSNGHKANCGCPICKNMKKNSKKGGGDIEDQKGDIEEGFVKGVSEPAKKEYITPVKEIPAKDDEYDELDAAEKGERGPNMVGGTRKRRGNGHKATCKCPICKNMKKKTRRHRKRSHRRR